MAIIPPPYVITDDDERGLAVVLTAIPLSFVWVCFIIRLWLQHKSVECWKLDDWFLIVATVLDTAQSAVMLHMIDTGLGKSLQSLSPLTLEDVGKGELVAQVLYIFALLSSKFVVLFFYLRFSPQLRLVRIIWGTIAVSVAWSITSITLIALPCNFVGFWCDGTKSCLGLWPRWQAISAIDIATEAVIILISVLLVAHLQMGWKSKSLVVVAFSARFPVIVATVFHLYYIHATLDSTDRTLQAAYYIVATQWHIGYAVMSTTITGLGPFLRPFSRSSPASYYHSLSDYRLFQVSSKVVKGQARTDLQEESYQMQPFRNSGARVDVTADDHELSILGMNQATSGLTSFSNPVLRPDLIRYNTSTTGGRSTLDERYGNDAASSVSQESRQWIIKKASLAAEKDRFVAGSIH